MDDHDEHNRGKSHHQSLGSVLEASMKSLTKTQLPKQPLQQNTSRKGGQPLILEAKFWNTLDIRMNL
jgi:hypothetical protein